MPVEFVLRYSMKRFVDKQSFFRFSFYQLDVHSKQNQNLCFVIKRRKNFKAIIVQYLLGAFSKDCFSTTLSFTALVRQRLNALVLSDYGLTLNTNHFVVSLPKAMVGFYGGENLRLFCIQLLFVFALFYYTTRVKMFSTTFIFGFKI